MSASGWKLMARDSSVPDHIFIRNEKKKDESVRFAGCSSVTQHL